MKRPTLPRRRATLFFACCLMVAVIVYVLPAPLSSQTGTLTYTTTWEWGDAVALAGGGWQVISDRGDVITVTDGYIVSRSVTANECAHTHTDSLFSWLIEHLLPNAAQAGHGTAYDPALVYESFVEPLAAPVTREWGTVTVPEPSYCAAHYLVAMANETTVGADEALYGTSLHLVGTVRAPGATAAQPFEIRAALGWGTINDLLRASDAAPVHAQIGTTPIHIAIERRLDTLFDGLDFASSTTDELARGVLRNLTDGTRFLVTAGRTHAA